MNFLRMHSITVIVGQNSCCKDGGEQHHLYPQPRGLDSDWITIFQPLGMSHPSVNLSNQNRNRCPVRIVINILP